MSTLVKTQFAPKHFNGFFGKDLFNELHNPAFAGSVPAVNVVESTEGFKIEVAAPGLQKGDFKLNLEKNQLTISAQKEQKEEESEDKYTRREFKYSSFQRTFTLPNSVDGEKIAATYADGILTVALPKREEAKEKPAREIEIA
ncbi:Hsp20/alpha crystallin family protein [Dyadobacter sp. CY312]|uniref:Hsp20/alpha crystallin family protein n=1 Tax=Dyadobacter sp. CY312 TaxID=2907303 RepID=UPI001F3048E7|nr:Hsp20/alpha crystallin family protein [Dyadobacter sp. CY312]MCE7042194.1 Hsp20/alpha crystallin family protein [Dyadobacter sp. CY312]